MRLSKNQSSLVMEKTSLPGNLHSLTTHSKRYGNLLNGLKQFDLTQNGSSHPLYGALLTIAMSYDFQKLFGLSVLTVMNQLTILYQPLTQIHVEPVVLGEGSENPANGICNQCKN